MQVIAARHLQDRLERDKSAKIEIQRFRSISWHQFDTLDNGSHPRQ
jgi:hypothetical protein